MCNAHPPSSKAGFSLHDTVCRVTRGIPCKAAHGLGAALGRLLGRPTPARSCCGHDHPAPADPAAQGGCGGHGGGGKGCGCGGKGASGT